MNKVEFIQKYEKRISELKEIRWYFKEKCNRSKKSTKEYKDAWKGYNERSLDISVLEGILEDFKSIK